MLWLFGFTRNFSKKWEVILRIALLGAARRAGGMMKDNSSTFTPVDDRPADPYITGLLSGASWVGNVITYAFPSDASFFTGYPAGLQPEYFLPMQESFKTGVLYWLGQISSFTQLQFVAGDPATATLRWGWDNKPGDGTGANFAGPEPYSGDAWFQYLNYVAPLPGNAVSRPIAHELGHQLGLKHPDDPLGGVVPLDHDSQAYTVMSYKDIVGGQPGDSQNYNSAPQTYMTLDIQAFQSLYGANFAYHAEDTVYTFDATTGQMLLNGIGRDMPAYATVYRTIWDGNGNDTYDFSSYGDNQSIDLNPGAWSTFSTALLAPVIQRQDGNGLHHDIMALGNIANALQYQGDVRSVIENARTGSGNDTVVGNYVDNTLDGGAGDDLLYGNGGNDTLIGGAGNDTLFGGAGANIMTGGVGNDGYYVEDSRDVVVETLGGGTDYVRASVDYTLGQYVENLNLAGDGNLNGTGNNFDNYVTGTIGNNRLDGGAGADVLIGYAGDDTFVIDTLNDQIIEQAASGQDTVIASITYTLGQNLENLTLTGTVKINGTGNALNNIITGNDVRNVLTGGDGNDSLSGGKGIDTMIGGAGNDTYYVDNVAEIVTELHGGGNDTVYSASTFTLSADIEKLILTGTGNTIATGNSLNNTLIGNDGNNKLLGGDGNDTLGGGLGNDTLDGGKGIDAMKGGAGNDKYYLDTSADLVTEYSNGGTDTVQINGTYTLTANVENLIIVGSSNRFGTGNALDNHITGNSGNNTLGGADGNDIIDGGKGADLMRGGTGNDTFYVDNLGDVVSEYSNAGTDLVFSSVNFVLGGNVENLTLTGTAGLKGTGNTLANILIGNAGNNVLDGGKGHDILTGDLGADTFVFGPNSGSDTITDFSTAQDDQVNLHAYTHGTANTALIHQVGADTTIDLGGGNIMTILDTAATDPAFLGHIVW